MKAKAVRCDVSMGGVRTLFNNQLSSVVTTSSTFTLSLQAPKKAAVKGELQKAKATVKSAVRPMHSHQGR